MYRRDQARPQALLGTRSALIAGVIVTALCVPAGFFGLCFLPYPS
jgi:hypothetical protein